MAIIDTLYREIRECPIEEIGSKIDGWVNRCRKENISVYALDILLNMRVMPERGTRNMYRFSPLKVSNHNQSIALQHEGMNNEREKEERKGIIIYFRKLLGK